MSAVDGTLPEGAVRRDVVVHGHPLALLESGHGDTVLLVPGFTGSKEDFQLLLGPLAAQGFRAVAVDQRGQYESPGPEDLEAYTVDALSRDLVGLVEQLGGPVHLVGHSFGGIVGRAAVLRAPELFRSFVLMGSGPSALIGKRADVLPFMKLILQESGLEALWDASQALPADPSKPANPESVVAFLRTRMLAHTEASLIGMADALTTEPDRVAELAAVGLPLLVVHGVRDDAWLPEVQDDMARRLGCPVVVIDDAWHSPAAENPEATAAALVDFLRSV